MSFVAALLERVKAFASAQDADEDKDDNEEEEEKRRDGELSFP